MILIYWILRDISISKNFKKEKKIYLNKKSPEELSPDIARHKNNYSKDTGKLSTHFEFKLAFNYEVT